MTAPARPLAGRVRRAEARDLARVAALFTGITEHHADLDPLFRMRPGASAEVEALVTAVARDPDAAIFVYESAAGEADAGSGGRVDGLCIVRVDRAPPILEEVVRAEITDLGVCRELRRRGIGRALVRAALDFVRARGVSRIEVRVASRNAEGQAFWRALGFSDLMDVLHVRL